MSFLSASAPGEQDDTWMSVSDLFAGLMMVFLLIAVIRIEAVTREKEQVKDVAVAFDAAEARLAAALEEEFRNDLEGWGAEIDKDQMLVRFKAPDVLFGQNSDVMRPRFREIMDDFFPRYAKVLSAHKTNVEEVRIEGHTSSDWGAEEETAFFGNMKLSQARTRSVLRYALGTVPPEDQAWLRTVVTANGLSSSRLVITNGVENAELSRRVEFRVRTDAKRQMVRILETLEG